MSVYFISLHAIHKTISKRLLVIRLRKRNFKILYAYHTHTHKVIYPIYVCLNLICLYSDTTMEGTKSGRKIHPILTVKF